MYSKGILPKKPPPGGENCKKSTLHKTLIPPKGFTLPLLSYGGTSMIFAIISLAIILRVDMENRTKYFKQKEYV